MIISKGICASPPRSNALSANQTTALHCKIVVRFLKTRESLLENIYAQPMLKRRKISRHASQTAFLRIDPALQKGVVHELSQLHRSQHPSLAAPTLRLSSVLRAHLSEGQVRRRAEWPKLEHMPMQRLRNV